MPKIVFYVVAAMLFLAALPLPYGFYTLIRLAAFIAFLWLAYQAYVRKDQTLEWSFGLVAILFNPVFPIYLSKEIWLPIDIITGLFMLWASKRFGV